MDLFSQQTQVAEFTYVLGWLYSWDFYELLFVDKRLSDFFLSFYVEA